MHFHLPIPFPKRLLLLRSYVLVAEENDASFCNQQTKLVFLLVCKLRKLHSVQFGPDVPCNMDNFCRGSE